MKRCQSARSYSPFLSSESFCMKKLCKYEFNCGSFLKQTFRAAEARWESILVKMFLKLVFKSCSGMSLLAVAAGSSFRPAGVQIGHPLIENVLLLTEIRKRSCYVRKRVNSGRKTFDGTRARVRRDTPTRRKWPHRSGRFAIPQTTSATTGPC